MVNSLEYQFSLLLGQKTGYQHIDAFYKLFEKIELNKVDCFGSFMSMFVIIIAGQAYPLTIFPDHTIVESSFYDNVIHSYVPSIYELGLGIGGIALALIIVLIGLANLKFLPKIIQSKNNNKSLEISSVD